MLSVDKLKTVIYTKWSQKKQNSISEQINYNENENKWNQMKEKTRN